MTENDSTEKMILKQISEIRNEISEMRAILCGQIIDGHYQDGFITQTNNKMADHERRIVVLETYPKAVKTLSFNVAMRILERFVLWAAVSLSTYFGVIKKLQG